jgi:hypothetical protein
MVRGGVGDLVTATDRAPIARLDRLAEELGIRSCRLIKIDIEGEISALRGGLKFIGLHRPLIYGEFNPFWMGHMGHTFDDAMSVLGPLGYRPFLEERPGRFRRLEGGGEPAARTSCWSPTKSLSRPWLPSASATDGPGHVAVPTASEKRSISGACPPIGRDAPKIEWP